MQRSNVPVKFPIPFANSATTGTYKRQVPTASQIGITAGAASLTDGFPPVNFQPLSSGGVPPFGQDENGILFQTTSWIQWLSAGVPTTYDSTFQSAIGGYPQGSIVVSATVALRFWISLVDNNTTNPDTGGANWRVVAPARSGEIFMWPFATPPGYALACDGTAYARTGIYQGLWLASSGGSPPFGPGDGSTTFTVPDMRGYFPRAWDNGRGVDPARTLGSSQADAVGPVPYGDVDTGSIVALDQAHNLDGTLNVGAAETRPKNIALQFCVCL